MVRNIPLEKFKEAYASAPRLVQEALNNPSTDQTVEQIRATNQLHVDISGKLSELLDHLMLGLISPGDFYQELLSLGITAENANAVIKEVNEKLFQPLQQRMRKESEEANSEDEEGEEAVYDPRYDPIPVEQPPKLAPIARETVPLASPMQIGIEHTTPRATPTPVPVYSHPAEFMESHAVATTVISQPNPTNQATVAPSPAPNEPYLPYARTMAEDMERAAHGLTGQPATPARSFQTASVPVTFAQPRPIQMQELAAPQQIQPSQQQSAQQIHAPVTATSLVAPTYPSQFSAPQQVPVPNYATPVPPPPPVMAPVRLTPVDRNRAGNAPITKEFGSDPYREPISV